MTFFTFRIIFLPVRYSTKNRLFSNVAYLPCTCTGKFPYRSTWYSTVRQPLHTDLPCCTMYRVVNQTMSTIRQPHNNNGHDDTVVACENEIQNRFEIHNIRLKRYFCPKNDVKMLFPAPPWYLTWKSSSISQWMGETNLFYDSFSTPQTGSRSRKKGQGN